MIGIQGQNELFNLIGAKLDKRVECMAIGGSAMMFYGAKTETRDVDLVFLDRKQFNLVKKALYEIGFNEKKNIRRIFAHYDLSKDKPIMMEGRDTRFDLFLNEVIGFKITKPVMERVREVHEFGNLIVKIASPEDIILLKCATEREKDRDDAASLIKNFNIDWNIIIEESKRQTDMGGVVYPAFLFEFLYELKEDFQAEIPREVIKKVMKLAEDIMVEQLKSGRRIKITRL